jgi:hypothetical protein
MILSSVVKKGSALVSVNNLQQTTKIKHLQVREPEKNLEMVRPLWVLEKEMEV